MGVVTSVRVGIMSAHESTVKVAAVNGEPGRKGSEGNMTMLLNF